MEKRKIGERLRKVREAAHVTKTDITKATGITGLSLIRYERDEGQPTLENLIRLADYFKVSTDYLLGRTEEIDKVAYGRFISTDTRINRQKPSDMRFQRKYEAAYPYNLLMAIFGETDAMRIIGEELYELDEDKEAGLAYALQTLSPKERDILSRRFESLMTFEECGRELNVTRERVRQIEARALRKLRNPKYCKYIRYGLKGARDMAKSTSLSEDVKRLEHQKEVLTREIEDIRESVFSYADFRLRNAGDLSNDEDTVDVLQLSVRSYNCLLRSGIKTLRDLDKNIREGKLLKIRNLGRKSAEEVIHSMEERTGKDYSFAKRW